MSAELQKYLEYVSKLQYDQVPNYKQMKELFTKAITSSGGRADGKLDFVAPADVSKTAKKRKHNSDEADIPKKIAKGGRGRKPALASSSSNSDSPVASPRKGRQSKLAKSPKPKSATAGRKAATSKTTGRSPGRSTGRSPGRSPSAKTASAAAKKDAAPKVQAYATKKSPGRPKGVYRFSKFLREQKVLDDRP